MEGHALPKNDDAYVRVKKELYEEYCKAIPLLTIDQTKNQEKVIEKQKQELTQIELMKLEHKQQVQLLIEDNKRRDKEMLDMRRELVVSKIERKTAYRHLHGDMPPEIEYPQLTREELVQFQNGIIPDKWKPFVQKEKEREREVYGDLVDELDAVADELNKTQN